jgi:DNA-directed RNA polymerase subunit RPC12/RpoP
MAPTPNYLDGNAVAGDLAEVFGTDMTRALGQCAGCGDQSALAQEHAYVDCPGTVLRCPGCGDALLRMVRTPSRVCLDTSGLSALSFATPSTDDFRI